MDEWIEIEGKNRKDAIERACNALNTNTSHLKYEIINEGRTTKIRAMKVEAVAKPVEREEVTSPEMKLERDPAERNQVEAADAEDEAEYSRPVRERDRERDERPRKPVPPDAGVKAKEALSTIVKYIDPSAEIELLESDEAIELNIKGERGGILIGKYGQTLGALQYLVAKMIGLDRADGKRLILDSEEYLARRKESLESLAEKLADKAARTKRPVGVEPMSASDRRIMHMALAEDPDVTTKSIGEGSSRRVLIVPRGYDESRRGGGGGSGGGGGRRNGRARGGGGNRGTRGAGDRQEAPARRRAGPPPRMHDSFDAPPEPAQGMFEEDDAPMISEIAATNDTNATDTDTETEE